MDYLIRITSDHPDSEDIVRAAGEKIACEINWGNDYSASIEVVQVESDDNSAPKYLAGWDMEPGLELNP